MDRKIIKRINKSKPLILREGEYTIEDLEKVKKENLIWKEIDIYQTQSEELFMISNPALRSSPDFTKHLRDFLKERNANLQIKGSWVYFPWSGVLIRMVNKKEYTALRTNRNQNLITEGEQRKLEKFTVGIVGLSAGSGIASSLAYSGISSRIKLAEYDTLDTTNLNRVRARTDQVGERKIDIVTQHLYEINPYIQPVIYEGGLDDKSLLKFANLRPKPRLIFEMIDNFEMKIRLRIIARKLRIPVIMFSNIGDRTLIDIERYDLNDKLPLFNGQAGDVPEDIIKNPDITDEDKHKYAVNLVGRKYIPIRALESVEQIGKTLVGRPQLMSTVTVSGGIGAYLARKIALGEAVPSGRRLVDFDKTFLVEANK